jgi:hypothetical protein
MKIGVYCAVGLMGAMGLVAQGAVAENYVEPGPFNP